MTSTIKEITKQEYNSIWYDRGPALSYNALYTFCLGARGTGKTFNYKCWALSKDTQTVWIRRTDEDIKDIANEEKFLSDVIAEGIISPDEIEDYKIKDRILYHCGLPKIFFVGLSTSARKKSQSYHNADLIVFDEFIEKDQRKYLTGEVELFLELYETVNRLRIDGRKEVRAIFIANKVSFVNPFFSYWNILPFEQRFKTFKDGLILVENYSNNKFAEIKKTTKFGKLINGTKYGDYAIDNLVWQDDNALIEDRPANSKLLANIHFMDNFIGIWSTEDTVYITPEHNKQIYTFGLKYQCKTNEIPMTFSSYPLKMIKEMYLIGRLRFADTTCKNVIFSLLQTETLK
ncbi:phage DNA encapsidation protein [Candidatus Methanoprimaticola sp. MG2]|uniref:phage DNA encapsidation protein n=1 Tax=Candidatus Methanoprimaticola sp. MG2 TaxID=3228838 RepID=UPI0039C6EC80